MKDSIVNARQSKVTFDIHSEIVVVGRNPEMADIDNPYGHIHGIAYFTVATYPSGLRFRHIHNHEDINKAEDYCERIQKANFFNLRYWQSFRPVYGSRAYEENMGEELALEKKEEEMY
jgi:hypothetical protein